MTPIYEWKDRADISVEAQVAGERLEALRVRNNGRLTPRAIVEDARQEESPLHPAFEWDDGVAAERYREEQARYVMRQIVVRLPQQREEQKPVRAFVAITEQRQAVYTSVETAMSDADLRAQILARAWRELRAWQERYREYEELSVLFESIERLEGELDLK